MRRWYLTLTLTLIALGVATLPAARERLGCRLSQAEKEAFFERNHGLRTDLGQNPAYGEVALLVIDTSGSVPKSPDRAVEAFHALRAGGLEIGAVTYSDQPQYMIPAHALPEEVLDVIDTLPTRGGSNPVGGLSLALDWYRDFGLQGRIVWVSDGSMNSGTVEPVALYQIADRAAHMGIRIDAVEVGTPDSTAMRDLALRTGGTWIQADQAVAGRL